MLSRELGLLEIYGGPEGRAFDATKYTCQCDG